MQDEEKLLTVAEFAVLANISKQRVYQLLNNRLNDYVVSKNGTKMIRESGIEAVKQARVKQGFNKSMQESNQDLIAELETLKVQNAELKEKLEKIKQTSSNQELTIERITEECERTRQHEEQVRAKLERVLQEAAAADAERKRADAAEHQCAVKDKQIEALTAALQSAQQQAAELTTALATSQALQAGQLRLAMQDSDSSGKPVENQTETTKAAVKQSNGTQVDGKKHGFFARLFRHSKK